ncbi:MAG TPA: ABC transporter permease [Propionibacteriaceae bacterium]|nr:ABC transporter permease [Propionibacteriaceae bacterium]
MTEILRFALAHARGDWRRTLAAAFAILVATTSFGVLTGSVSTARLVVTQTVEDNFRSTYDVLVRPAGSASAMEQSLGAVRPNFLTETFGGITLDQVRQITAITDVEVAAPVAVLGQVQRNVMLKVDVGQVLGTREHAMVRFSLNGAARNGTGETSTNHGYLYLTRSPLKSVDDVVEPANMSAQVEERASGPVTVCLASSAGGRPATPGEAFRQFCTSVTGEDPGVVEALLMIPMAIQAIDPAAEHRLTGLDQAITTGRALTVDDGAGTADGPGGPLPTATAVMATGLPFDFRATLVVEELDQRTIDQVMATTDAHRRRDLVLDATPVRTVASVERDASEAYSQDIVANSGPEATADGSLIALSIIQPERVTYSEGTPLVPDVVACEPTVWLDTPDGVEFGVTAPSVCDTGFRTLTVARADTRSFMSFNVVGTYDPDLVQRPSNLNDVPLESYRSSVVTGADEASARVLGDEPMMSDLNPAGYMQSPPALLVPLQALPLMWEHFPDLDRTAPVSSVRVRVAGVTGTSAADRERIRVVAEQIRERTGLDVDITAGASLQNQQVALPATDSGTPALLVNEQWTKKGVAVAIADALDTKSIFLLALVLASSALTVWLTATATVASRRGELATLACLGWTPAMRRSVVMAELGLVGGVAGVAGAVLSLPITAALDVAVAWPVLVAAIPLGVLLALVPGLAATDAAGRVAPAEAFRPAQLVRGNRARQVGGPLGVGIMMLRQRPGRLAVGAVGVALAVTSAALLGSILAHFRATLIGSFLGDAVAVQVRTPDLAAAVLIGVLGLTALGTLLFLGLAEDARSLAALRAVGWTDRMLGATVLVQALVVSGLGALIGTLIALVTWASAFGGLDATTALTTVAVALGAIIASLVTALVPATWAGRLPTARILSSE